MVLSLASNRLFNGEPINDQPLLILWVVGAFDGENTAFIAFHLGAELIERHRAEHRDPLAEHPERHPDRSLAALASDPGITLGFELGDSSVVCHPRIEARTEQERTSFGTRSIPGAAYGLREFFS